MCSPVTCQWLFNNLRGLSLHPPAHRELIATCITRNEAINFELNSAYKNNGSAIYYPTVALQLRYFEMSRLHAHCTAMYNPTLYQVRNIDQRALMYTHRKSFALSANSFCEFNRRLVKGLPLLTQRMHLMRLYPEHLTAANEESMQKRARARARAQKRPAAAPLLELKQPALKRVKRNAFTLKRRSV